jgi:hypothetical protein
LPWAWAAWLSGYASRTHPSEGVVHDLWAKALVMEDGGGGRVVIVATDLIGLPREVSDEVAARLRKRYGIERPQLMLNSSHTHCGPAVWPGLKLMFNLSPEDERATARYAEKLVEDLVRAVGLAMADRGPAEVFVGHGSAGFAMNRREPSPKGVRLGVNRDGPVDHDVPVLKIAGPQGKLRAVLFGYACHNTTLGGNYYRINGDYAGFAALEVERAYPGATAMFLQLCGGDQNPYPRGTLELAQEYGRGLAAEVGRVLRGQLRPVRPPIGTAYQVVDLQYAARSRASFEAEAAAADPFARRRAKVMLAAWDTGHPVTSTPYPVQAVRWGKDLTLLALGGEVVADYALRLKRELAGENLVVAGYSNDVMGYIPSRRILGEGGYEPVTSTIYYGQPGPLADNVEDTIVAACRRVFRQAAHAGRVPEPGPSEK